MLFSLVLISTCTENHHRLVNSLHALLEQGQTAGLTDDQVSPLNDDNGHKECCMAGVLQLLPLGICLLILSI